LTDKQPIHILKAGGWVEASLRIKQQVPVAVTCVMLSTSLARPGGKEICMCVFFIAGRVLPWARALVGLGAKAVGTSGYVLQWHGTARQLGDHLGIPQGSGVVITQVSGDWHVA